MSEQTLPLNRNLTNLVRDLLPDNTKESKVQTAVQYSFKLLSMRVPSGSQGNPRKDAEGVRQKLLQRGKTRFLIDSEQPDPGFKAQDHGARRGWSLPKAA